MAVPPIDTCDSVRARVRQYSPVSGKDFVGSAAKEERVRAAVDLIEIVPGFSI
ncbi:hypothetical protein [Arthrobacter sp. R4-81]